MTCKMNVLGTRWMVCEAPAEGPCYCDVVAAAATDEPPLLDDVACVLDMALGSTHGAASVVAELRRVRARIGQVQECTTA